MSHGAVVYYANVQSTSVAVDSERHTDRRELERSSHCRSSQGSWESVPTRVTGLARTRRLDIDFAGRVVLWYR